MNQETRCPSCGSRRVDQQSWPCGQSRRDLMDMTDNAHPWHSAPQQPAPEPATYCHHCDNWHSGVHVGLDQHKAADPEQPVSTALDLIATQYCNKAIHYPGESDTPITVDPAWVHGCFQKALEAYAASLRHEIAALKEENERLGKVLHEISNNGDCLCEHDTEDCCANCDPLDFWCPQCVAAKALRSRIAELEGKN